MYTSQVSEFGLSVEPWHPHATYKAIWAMRPIAQILDEATQSPRIYADSVRIAKMIILEGWSVVAEQHTAGYGPGYNVLLKRPTDGIPDVDPQWVGSGFREVTRSRAEYFHDEGYNLVVQLRHYWKCPSGARGCDVGYLSAINGEVKTTTTWQRYSPINRAIFGHAGSDVHRYFIEYYDE